jgi:hypothetical protein
MDLDLDNLIGRKDRPVLAEIVRPLEPADLALLATERGVQPTAIKRLTDSHHALARCLAEGMKDVEAAAITGYTPSRISILRDSPLFAELIEHYRSNKNAVLADLHERMVTAGLVAVQELANRLEDEPEKIATSTLLEAVKTLADRTGHGPQTKSTNVNISLSLAERVAEGRRRAMSALRVLGPGQTIDAVAVPALSAAKGDREDAA